MTNTQPAPVTDNDADLVNASLAGNRDAFGQIVRRYQSLICAVAYSATGNLNLSEDLAQETFITAWQHLAELREPALLRSWLRGIARNLIGRALRSQQREPSHRAAPLDEITEPSAPEPLPSERAVSREEADILWRSLERIPENYREPLVLYYREHQSAETVALSLGISEELVRQRLARGRKLLHAEVLTLVEDTLARTSPGVAFTQAVVTMLPSAVAAAKAGSLGLAAAKGGAGLKSLLSLSAWAGLLSLVGLAIFQWKIAVDETKSARERRFMVRAGWIQILVFVATLAVVFFWIPRFYHRPLAFSILLGLLFIINTVFGGGMLLYVPRRQA